MSTKVKQNAAAKKTLVIFGGSKGGVTKSTSCSSMADCLLEAKQDFVLLDTDPANADAHLICGDVVIQEKRYLVVPVRDTLDPLIVATDKTPAKIVLANCGAGDAPLLVRHAARLQRAAQAQDWRVVVLLFFIPEFASIQPLWPVAQALLPWAEVWLMKAPTYSPEGWALWPCVKVPVSSGNPSAGQPIQTALVGAGALEREWPLLPADVILASHDATWRGLRAHLANTSLTGRFDLNDYRKAVAGLAHEMHLIQKK